MYQDFNRRLSSTTLERVWLQTAPEIILGGANAQSKVGVGPQGVDPQLWSHTMEAGTR